MAAFVDILRCADGSYYVGSTRGDSLDRRLGEHHAGTFPGYASSRHPVVLVYATQFEWITDAIAFERRLKGWSRAKKEALIASDWEALQRLAKRPLKVRTSNPPTSSFEAAHAAPQDEVHGGRVRSDSGRDSSWIALHPRLPPRHNDNGGVASLAPRAGRGDVRRAYLRRIFVTRRPIGLLES
ncbi:GIY-YIG nuclease family protein [Methylobacterium sp. W2]|uniref:GIY-YIG nuclease family protein n=1 Tax=Methylobacterium sp. W2 TaxID=2598107 RepID=UPI0029CAC141|nr:GIY-YIG nuclease family protein [Methylobacterium sp. W2]MCC0804782.1 GIY-YIG nuclease family protein [Methylobacterium sp. W2]